MLEGCGVILFKPDGTEINNIEGVCGRVQCPILSSSQTLHIFTVAHPRPKARWNTNGTVLALSGTARAAVNKSGHSRDLSVVKLYSPYGLALRTLKVGILFFLRSIDPIAPLLVVFGDPK